MKNGVPVHIALGQSSDSPRPLKLDQLERMAMSITFREFEGAEFDFSIMSWKQVK